MSDMITRSIIVKAGVEDAFRAWANFENFPNFMKYIESVNKTGERTSYWKMNGPLGKTVEWEAETTLFEENKRIGWSTKDRENGNLTTSGQVTFTPLEKEGETQITVMLNYVPQAGITGGIISKLFANPEAQLEEDLQNFKNYVEGMYDRTAR